MSLISAEQFANCKRMLFVSPVALGDFLYLKTFLIALKNKYPHIELDIWLDDNRRNTDSWRLSRSKILQQWMAAEPAFGLTYGCTDSDSAVQDNIKQAKLRNYDLIFCHSVSKSKQYSKIARAISSNAFIVSSLPKVKYWGLLDSLQFKHSDARFRINPNELPSNHHITDRYANIFEKVTGLVVAKNELMPSMVIPQSMQPITDAWIKNRFNDESRQGPLIFLNHLSTNTKKDWDIEQLFDLILRISATALDNRFIINVTRESFDEVSLATEKFTANNSLQIAVFTVEDHFFELPSLIAKSDFVITVDTAILHFAFAAKRPLISMMRSKKPYWAPPASKQSHVLYATEGKGYVSDISVDKVYAQYLTMTN
ncbi:glycosyltransferase family 9 protein [Shewanella donghaensis]|uniref:glycosyltransferase family 9 protein n=1 Tax=Shewanella donghaensis TaxID=238836 RepID=UPI001182A725|nr:glycosyltransferase family 9 protein [Shewanella donghaensis]